jgi:uncharacterized OB-fold protein
MQTSDYSWALPNSVHITDHGPAMAAGLCTQCETKVFPKPRVCHQCLCTDIADVRIEGTGNLYSYSVVHAARKGWPSPYAIAYVDFPGDVRICGPLDISKGKPELDTLVSISVAALREDEAGVSWFAHQFTPVENGGVA